MSNTRRLRVTFTLSGYGVVARGAELFVRTLSRHLASDVDCCVLGRGPAGDGCVHVPAWRRDHPVLRTLDATPIVGHAMRTLNLGPLNVEWMTSSLCALPWLLRNPPDVLIPEGGLWGGLLGALLRRLRGTPFVDVAHGAPGKWERAAARRRPDRYVALTQVALDDMRRAVPGLNGMVIPMGVDTQSFAPTTEAMSLDVPHPRVLCVSALEDMKRIQLTIQAVGALEHGSLVLAGRGPLAEELDREASRILGPARYCRLALDHSEMPALYAACDVFTLPSQTESFALSYLEAMATNLPVVTHDDAVRREIVGEAGIACPCEDLPAYTRALHGALTRDWKDMPRMRAMNYSWPSIARRYMDLFRVLTAGAGSG